MRNSETCRDETPAYIYIILVWMALKCELGLAPILRYGACVILLRGSHERFGQSRRVCVSKEKRRRIRRRSSSSSVRVKTRCETSVTVLIGSANSDCFFSCYFFLFLQVARESECLFSADERFCNRCKGALWNVSVSRAHRVVRLSLSSFEFSLRLRRNLDSRKAP